MRARRARSELVAGALQDHDRALIVGRPSFGKSLLMGGFPMTDGSMIELVIGHVRTPCGRIIQRQYRTVTRREYYRLARAERDTVGRPSCRTDRGRVVYGGGGIYPDIVFADRCPRRSGWLGRVRTICHSSGWPATHRRTPPRSRRSMRWRRTRSSLGAGRLPGVRRQGRDRRADDAESDGRLQRALVRGVSAVKWGDEGYYRITALTDPDVAAAQAGFDKAQAILAAK